MATQIARGHGGDGGDRPPHGDPRENCSDFIRLISNKVGKVVPFHYTSWQNVPDQFKKAIFPTLF
ncbi:hypothetical protein R6Q59_006241, partial [Mikania micrantha]